MKVTELYKYLDTIKSDEKIKIEHKEYMVVMKNTSNPSVKGIYKDLQNGRYYSCIQNKESYALEHELLPIYCLERKNDKTGYIDTWSISRNDVEDKDLSNYKECHINGETIDKIYYMYFYIK